MVLRRQQSQMGGMDFVHPWVLLVRRKMVAGKHEHRDCRSAWHAHSAAAVERKQQLSSSGTFAAAEG